MTQPGDDKASFHAWVRDQHVGELCTHGPKDQRAPIWIIKFEDASRGDSIFDNETEAVDFYLQASNGWNCTLLTTVRIAPLTAAAQTREEVIDHQPANQPAAPDKTPPGPATDTLSRAGDKRAAFEEWVKRSRSFTDWSRVGGPDGDGEYLKPLVHRTWLAWCAAVNWTLAAAPSPPAQSEGPTICDDAIQAAFAAKSIIATLTQALAEARKVIEFYRDEWIARPTAVPIEEPTDALMDDAGKKAREWADRNREG